jgi:hypothetical protein
MKEEQIRSMGQVQEEVRERFNPEWRQQLAMHRAMFAGPGSAVDQLLAIKRAGREARRRRKL